LNDAEPGPIPIPRNDIIFQNGPEAEDRADDQGFLIPGNAILETFEIAPFASIRQIAR
jgi:hypothetical protein